MKKSLSLFLTCLFFQFTLVAQTGKVGINTTTPAAMLHVKDSSVLFSGLLVPPIVPGNPPAAGQGVRMMWYPDMAAFRAGYVTGTQWNKENLGYYSTALGTNTIASGPSSIATGSETRATGYIATAFGGNTTASGDFSTSLGAATKAKSFASVALGQWNDTSSISPSTWNLLDPLFIIGNGLSNTTRSNAMTVLKNGNVGLGTISPTARLHVKDSSVLFTGLVPLPFPPGNPPVSGAGTRMMWYADKGAFRMGNVEGTQWNKDSIGTYSIGVGQNVKAKGLWSMAMGYQTTALGWASAAIGHTNTASGNISIALGAETTASGTQSIAMGTNTEANGEFATAMGGNSIASGYVSTAIGHTTIASGFASVAMGYFATASGEKTTAMGSSTIASGGYSTAMGAGTIASGTYSTSMGFNTKAVGITATSMGFNTIARPYASLVLGRYNDTTSINSTSWDVLDPVFVIGNGSSHAARTNAFTVLKSGKTGINTADPQAMLHIIKNGSSVGPFHSNATAILESNQHSYIQFSQTNTTESGFLSGNNLTAIRSALIFSADSSMLIRTGGNTTRVKISNTGNVGLGTLSPAHELHVVNNNSADGGWTEGIMIENINANTGEAAISLKNVAMPLNNQWMMGLNQNPSLAFNYGASFSGGNTKMVIDTFGKVGVGTISPTALLDIDGTVKIGTNGNALSEIIKATIVKDVASIPANTTLGVDFAVANSATTSSVFVSPENDLNNGIVIAFARVSAAGNVRVGFRNTTAAAIDPASMNYYITVIR